MRRTLLILLLAVLLPSVSAQFLAFGEPTIIATPCQVTSSNVTIQNTGQEPASYAVSVDGPGADYVTFSAITFTLQPQQAIVVNTNYAIPCTLQPDTYPLTIYFTSDTEERVLEQDIIVAVPDNLNATIQPASHVITPCQTAQYTLSLHNPLNFTEIYRLNADGHPSLHLGQERVILEGNQQANVLLTISPDDCTESGFFPITLDIETEKSRQQETHTLDFAIKTTDIPDLAEGITSIRTDYIDSTAEIPVKNIGDRQTTYRLSVDGVPWASVTPETITLQPGETQLVGLRLTPTEEFQPADYPALFTATVEQTGLQYSKELTIKLQPPTALEQNPGLFIGLGITGLIVLALLAYLLVLLFSKRTRFANKRKKFAEKYRKWKAQHAAKRAERKKKREAKRKAREEQRKAKQEKKKKALERKRAEHERRKLERERAKKSLHKEVLKEFKKDYHLVVRKDIIRPTKKRNIAKYLAILLSILIILLVAVSWSVIAPNFAYVLAGVGILLAVYLAKKLSRTRIAKKQWKLLLANHPVTLRAWKKGLNRLTITSKDPVKHFKILAAKTKPPTAPSPAVYQTFGVKTNADASLSATFTIPKRWLKRKGITAEDVRLSRYRNAKWARVPLTKTGESARAVHFTADIKAGTHSLHAKPKPKQRKKWHIGWGLAGIALAVALAILVSPQPGIVTEGIPPQAWQQDTIHQIDLADYFTDPDSDTLTYSVTETEHLTIDITEGIAYLTPDTGWTGEERAKFTATDNKGATVTSNTVVLRVQENLVSPSIQPFIAITLSLITIGLLIWVAVRLKKK